jgi:hypothetical protein
MEGSARGGGVLPFLAATPDRCRDGPAGRTFRTVEAIGRSSPRRASRVGPIVGVMTTRALVTDDRPPTSAAFVVRAARGDDSKAEARGQLGSGGRLPWLSWPAHAGGRHSRAQATYLHETARLSRSSRSDTTRDHPWSRGRCPALGARRCHRGRAHAPSRGATRFRTSPISEASLRLGSGIRCLRIDVIVAAATKAGRRTPHASPRATLCALRVGPGHGSCCRPRRRRRASRVDGPSTKARRLKPDPENR